MVSKNSIIIVGKKRLPKRQKTEGITMTAKYIRCTRQCQFGRESIGTLFEGVMPESGDALLEDYAEQVQMVYLDPPFGTGKRFEMKVRVGEAGYRKGSPTISLPAYDDRWPDREAYLKMLRDTLIVSRNLLRKDGTIFVHVDARMNAHVRLLLDEIFGESNFLNEIIWSYQTGGRAKTYFPRKHDVILFYAKSKNYYFNLKGAPIARNEARSNHMRRSVDEAGRSYRSIMSGGKEYRYYDDEPAYPGDVWEDISHLQQKDPQRTGYETQKPLKLLERLIRCTTREGDLVCDLFCGSGTTAVAAAALGRRFLCLDESRLAVAVTGRRLSATDGRLDSEPYAFDVIAPCAADDCEADVEVYPAITSYTVRMVRFESRQAREAGIGGLDAVEQWAAGFVQGDVFRAVAWSTRSHMTPALSPVLEIPVLQGEPCVMIVDIWGGRRFYLPQRRY